LGVKVVFTATIETATIEMLAPCRDAPMIAARNPDPDAFD